MNAPAATETEPHQASLAVWAVPATVAAGDRFTVTIGVKSAAGVSLAGGRVEIRDQAGAVIAATQLGGAPWPGTDALYWAEISIEAPREPDPVALTAKFDPAGLDEPHRDALSDFTVTVVAGPEHNLTVTVAAGATPVDEAYIRLGPYRAVTDAAGRARLALAAGRYTLQVWKAGYEISDLDLDVAADTAIDIEARPEPDDDPDAVWTA